MKKRIASDRLIAKIISYTVMTVIALVCVLPFVLVVSGSFTANESIIRYGYSLLPRSFSLEAYAYAFRRPTEILYAYRVTIIVTTLGTVLSILLCSMAAYVLSRKEYKHRNKLAFYFFFTTVFSGGLVPWYVLCVKYLHFKEMPYVALIMASVFSFYNVVILRSFMSSIPDSLVESAKIDGAKHFLIYWKIVMPLCKPALATIALFVGLSYWNNYFNSLLFTSKPEHTTLQFYLYKIINMMKNVNNEMLQAAGVTEYPAESFKMAMTVITTGPVLLAYPFAQKYLVKGMTVGAVKG